MAFYYIHFFNDQHLTFLEIIFIGDYIKIQDYYKMKYIGPSV